MSISTELIELRAPKGPPVRLDVFLVRHLAVRSRQRASELIRHGLVRINGHRARKGDTVHAEDLVGIAAAEPSLPSALPGQPELAIPVLYEDAAVVAVAKPAGMPTHALRSDERGTVSNFLVARYPEMRGVSDHPGEAGVVHRLDTGTSGVLLTARTAEAYRAMRRQFHDRAVRKAYIAIVTGHLTGSGTIDTPIAHAPRHPQRMLACPNSIQANTLKARPARTHYRALERLTDATLVAVEIETGVRHQIRVHLASIGHPVIGDPLYGSTGGAAPAVRRPMLHASRLRFHHPVSGETVTVEAPLPEDFVAALEQQRTAV